MCSDGASVNVKLHRLVQEELGAHYTLVLYPSHKVELAIGDAFKLSELNSQCHKCLLPLQESYIAMASIQATRTLQ